MKVNQKIAVIVGTFTQMMTSGYAYAQVAGKSDTADAIIVTARRMEERLQDVPISISVVAQDRIDNANIVTGEDLAKVVPGLNVQSKYGAENTNFAIRGFSQEAQTSASVGVYFGEVVAPRSGGPSIQSGDGAGPGSLFDLQNVQVLKGPQGTLFGRNTTGGAVVLTPRKPVDHFEGYLEGSYGNFDMMRVQGVVNVPLASWARLRVGVDRLTRDGYVHNVSGIGPRDFYDADYVAVRGSLVLDLSPDIENYTIVSYLNSDNHGQPNQTFAANPNLFFGALAVPQVARLTASSDKYQIEQHMPDPRNLTKQFQIINTLTWHASDNLTIKDIASYSRFKSILRQDLFSTNFPIAGGIIATADLANGDGLYSANQINVTNELQFQGRAMDTKLNYQFGTYFEHSSPASLVGNQLPSIGSICTTNSGPLIADFRCSSTSSLTANTGSLEFINMAAYAQATYALTDQLKLTGGLRETYDRSRGVGTGLSYKFTVPAGQFFGTAATPAVCANQFPNCTQNPKTSTTRPTWTVNLAYSPSHDLMAYATYSRGYRQGAASPFFVYPGGEASFKPEKVDSFEAGVKTSFHGSISGDLNAAVFYSDLTDQQILFAAISLTGGGTATSIVNAGKSRVYGFDVDASLRFSSSFRLNGAVTYVNSKLVSFQAISLPGFILNPTAVQGSPLPYTPKWGVNVGGIVTLPVPAEYGKVEFAATYRYNSRSGTGAGAFADAVSQVDLSLDWRDVGGKPIDLSLFGSNMTNQFTATGVAKLLNSFGFDSRYLGRPRMFGVRAKMRFGNGQ